MQTQSRKAQYRKSMINRRQALAGMVGGLASWQVPFGHASGRGGVIARGRVFHDRNGTGVRQAGDPGIAGVLVSNGRDVVATDSDGRWRLPVADGQHVFVIKPPDWSVPLGRGNVPVFSRLHQPTGSPAGLNFPGVGATGIWPEEIDFSLRPNPETKRYDVALIADTQPANTTELGYLHKALIEPLLNENVQFAIHHGDVLADDLSLFGLYLDHTAQTGFAWHHCPGNHDMNYDSADGASAFETWKRVFGPTHYAFQAGATTFIILNNVEYAGNGPRPSGMPVYRGLIGERQLAFVRNLLRHIPPDQLIVVSMHIPLASYDTPGSLAHTTGDAHRLLATLSDRAHCVSFSGHSHTTEHHYLGAAAGFGRKIPHHHQVLTAACGSWWSGPPNLDGIPVSDSRDGSPKGFHVLSIDGHHYETRFVSAELSPMRILLTARHGTAPGEEWDAIGCGRILPSPARLPVLDDAVLVVDFFDGGPRSRVVADIEGHESVTLTRRFLADPYIVETFANQANPLKDWIQPCASSHVWTAELPGGLKAGLTRVTVQATGEFGRSHTATSDFEISAA
jgi:C terminal of Calcineurin-like phosphoesterase/N terminal of Calcineurin-like phosphoesterase/Calcineurin-like phosphoesterase